MNHVWGLIMIFRSRSHVRKSKISIIARAEYLLNLRYDDDLDDVEEEDHFEDVDDLEVKSSEKLSLSLSIEMSQLRRTHIGHTGG